MWILEHCIWEDIGIWDDTDFWCDSPAPTGIVLTADAGALVLAGQPVALLVTRLEAPPIFGGGVVPGLPRPPLVEGTGFGILPQLEGEAFGVVGVAGDGAAHLPNLVVVGIGAAGANGKSLARLVVKAAASGQRGSAGRAVGHIESIKAIGIGNHDDDEAVAIKFLLDA